MLEKAEQGFWPSSAPLGYRNIVGPNGRKTNEPDPDVAPILTRLFEWYATGHYAFEDITAMAQTAGLVSRRSKSPLPRGTIHTILRTRIYMGDFAWKGRMHQGVHGPLVTRELWEGVQKVLDHHFATRHRKVGHDFACSQLIACGHCGCSLVGEIKKGRYIYDYCTGFKGKFPEPHVRQEVLEVRFTDLLKGLAFDEEVMGWMTEALRQSYEDERRDHAEAMTQLQSEKRRLLDFILSNCTWKEGARRATFREQFDLIIESTKACAHKRAAGVASSGSFENWRG